MCELFELFWLQASASDSTAASSTEISTAYCSLAEMYLTDEWWALNYHLLFTFAFDLKADKSFLYIFNWSIIWPLKNKTTVKWNLH